MFILKQVADATIQHGIKALWLDYEMDGEEHRKRLEQFYGQDMPEELYYLRCRGSLVSTADQIRDHVERLGINLLVVDSASFAAEGSISEPESATEFFSALRSIGRVGSIIIGHVNKAMNDEFPFGSVHWHNGARATWFLSGSSNTDGVLRIEVAPRKANLKARSTSSLVYELRGDGDNGSISLTEASFISQMDAPEKNIADEVEALLQSQGPMTREAIYEALQSKGKKHDSVKKAINRSPERFQIKDGLVSIAVH
jgi:hypothetical protein